MESDDKQLLSRVLEIVENEPEYPTPIPILRQLKYLMWSIFYGRGIVQPMMRIACWQTKEEIANKISQLEKEMTDT